MHRSTKSIFVDILIVLSIIVLFARCTSNSDDDYTSTNTNTNHYKETTCDWCGQRKYCQEYWIQVLAGTNRDGSFKYDDEFMYFCSSCVSKANREGVKYGWVSMQPIK